MNYNTAMNFDAVIIGGGAAGLACAVRILRKNTNLKIAIVEAGERLGKKLASTGNGQGNITNKNMSIENYFGGRPDIIKEIALSSNALDLEEELFHCLLQSDEVGRVYPMGRQASALVDSLIYEIGKGSVAVYLNARATDIDKNLTVTLSNGRMLCGRAVVLCTGGKAQRQYKTDGSSYSLAQKLSHTLTPLFPSLVQLKTETTDIKALRGIRVDCVVTAICGGRQIKSVRGDVIFTDYGVSGNAIFAISPYIADKGGVTLSIDFLPCDEERIIDDIEIKKRLGYEDSELLSGTLHNQIGRAIIKRCGIVDSALICKIAKNFTLRVLCPLGFDYAQVTRGGINMNEVTCSLESKFVKNLFFAGEILDVDGCCGGYNLHWAFASGFCVADEILKRL